MGLSKWVGKNTAQAFLSIVNGPIRRRKTMIYYEVTRKKSSSKIGGRNS